MGTGTAGTDKVVGDLEAFKCEMNCSKERYAEWEVTNSLTDEVTRVCTFDISELFLVGEIESASVVRISE